MDRNVKLTIGLVLLGLGAVVIATYAYIQSREFFRGPRITITEPLDGATLSEAPVTIGGRAENVAYISLNGAPIFTDSKGDFSEKLLLLPGYNILTVKAEDRFGKRAEKTLELVYKPQIQKTKQIFPSPS